MFKYKYSKLYWFLKSFEWMEIYFSPFKPPIPRLYIGKVAIGTPYFLPRVWKKATPKRAHEATQKFFKDKIHYNSNTNNKVKSYDEVFAEKMKYSYAVPLKIGFSFCGLGWKTKWSSTDYIFEYQPVWSFVTFGYQVALTFNAPEPYHYWTCWLYYNKNTDKNKTVKERIEQARKEFPNTWNTYSNGEKTKINYWDVTLKKKWRNN